MSRLVDDHVRPVGLGHGRNVSRHLHVGLAFVREAFALVIDADAVIDNVERVRAGRSVDRTAVVLVNVDDLRHERERKIDVLTCDDARTADRHLGPTRTDVLRDHGLIGGEAARGQHDAELRMNFGETFLRLDAHTVHGARLFIGKQCHGLRIEADLDTKLLGLLHERQGQLAATRLVFANNEMCAGKHRPDKLGTSRKVDAAITVKPFKGGIGVFANNTSELFISLALRDLHPVLEELFGGIALNILGLLEGGIDAKEEARSINRVARRHGHLFKKKRLEAVFSRAHGTGEAATTSAQNDDVVLGGGRSLGFSGNRAECSTCTNRSHGGGLEEFTTRGSHLPVLH